MQKKLTITLMILIQLFKIIFTKFKLANQCGSSQTIIYYAIVLPFTHPVLKGLHVHLTN